MFTFQRASLSLSEMKQSLLLRGESSDQSNRSRGIFRRSDAITYGSNYEKAAAFIDLVRSRSSFAFSPSYFCELIVTILSFANCLLLCFNLAVNCFALQLRASLVSGIVPESIIELR